MRAILVRRETVGIECLWAAVRRSLVLQANTPQSDFGQLFTEWMARRHATDVSLAGVDVLEQSCGSDDLSWILQELRPNHTVDDDDMSTSYKRSGGGGAWRQLLFEEAGGTTGTQDLGALARLYHDVMRDDAARREQLQSLGRVATRLHRLDPGIQNKQGVSLAAVEKNLSARSSADMHAQLDLITDEQARTEAIVARCVSSTSTLDLGRALNQTVCLERVWQTSTCDGTSKTFGVDFIRRIGRAVQECVRQYGAGFTQGDCTPCAVVYVRCA